MPNTRFVEASKKECAILFWHTLIICKPALLFPVDSIWLPSFVRCWYICPSVSVCRWVFSHRVCTTMRNLRIEAWCLRLPQFPFPRYRSSARSCWCRFPLTSVHRIQGRCSVGNRRGRSRWTWQHRDSRANCWHQGRVSCGHLPLQCSTVHRYLWNRWIHLLPLAPWIPA